MMINIILQLLMFGQKFLIYIVKNRYLKQKKKIKYLLGSQKIMIL